VADQPLDDRREMLDYSDRHLRRDGNTCAVARIPQHRQFPWAIFCGRSWIDSFGDLWEEGMSLSRTILIAAPASADIRPSVPFFPGQACPIVRHALHILTWAACSPGSYAANATDLSGRVRIPPRSCSPEACATTCCVGDQPDVRQPVAVMGDLQSQIASLVSACRGRTLTASTAQIPDRSCSAMLEPPRRDARRHPRDPRRVLRIEDFSMKMA